MKPVIAIYLLWLGQAPSAPTPDQVRQAMSVAIDSVKTAHVVYIEDKSLPPPRPEELRRLASPQSITPDEDAAHNRRLIELSKTSHMKVSLELDAQAGVWRVSREDLRDLNAIMARESFPSDVRGYVDQSGVLLADRNFSGRLATGIGWLSNREEGQPFASPLVNSHLRIGAVPDELFQQTSRSSIAASGSEAEQLFQVTLERAEGAKIVLEVDPKIGYRYRTYKSYGRGGNLGVLEEASDYRLVDGVYFPFQYEATSYDSAGAAIGHEKIVVQEARFNQKLPPDALKLVLAPGTRISGTPRGPLPPRIDGTQVLGMKELKALYAVPAASQPQR